MEKLSKYIADKRSVIGKWFLKKGGSLNQGLPVQIGAIITTKERTSSQNTTTQEWGLVKVWA